MKTRIIFFITSFGLAFVCGQTRAQEYRKVVANVKSDTSIVRRVDSQNRLVYNSHINDNRFMMYTDNSTSTQNLILPDDVYVSDFMVRDGMVYFCGRKIESSVKNAMLGFFDLASYPNSTVYYYTNNYYAEFDKIESYTVYSASSSQLHIVLTAKKADGDWTLMDSYELSLNRWGFVEMLCDSTAGHTFLSLAVTDSYVLATSVKQTFSTANSYLWYLTKPTVFNSTMFQTLVKRRKHPGISSRSMRVGQAVSNRFITACIDGTQSLDVRLYNGVYFIGGCKIPLNSFNPIVKCMKYNTDQGDMDILVYDPLKDGYNGGSSRVFHLPWVIPSARDMISYHNYSGHRLFSLDYLGNFTGCFATSGLIPGEDVLRLYKYYYDGVGTCETMQSVPLQDTYTHLAPVDQLLTYWGEAFWRRTMTTTTGSSQIMLDCESSTTDNN